MSKLLPALLSLSLAVSLSIPVAGCGGGEQPKPVAQPAAPRPDPVLAGVVVTPIAGALTPGDRIIAGKAQYNAVVEGKQRSWKGKGGTFGFISPGPARSGAKGNCREYSHTIYVNGRPQTGKGSACETAPGQWSYVG